MNVEAIALVKKLKRRSITLSTAESITGGGLGEVITSVPGSSEVFLGGVITYSDRSKTKLLNVPKPILTKHTAVSEEVARLMAEECRELFKSHIAIATTGVAGPGRAYGQPAGTAWIAIATKKETQTIALALKGSREEIRHAVIESALAALERILIS